MYHPGPEYPSHTPSRTVPPTAAWWCALILQLCAGVVAHFVFTFTLDSTPDVAALHTAGAFAFLNAAGLLAVAGWLGLVPRLGHWDRAARVAAVLAVAAVSIATGIGSYQGLPEANIFMTSELTHPWTTPFALLPLVFLNPLLGTLAALPVLFPHPHHRREHHGAASGRALVASGRARVVSALVLAGVALTAGLAAGVWPAGEITERVTAIEAERAEAEQRYAAEEPARLEAEREYKEALREAVETFVPNAEAVAYELLRSGLTPEQMSRQLPGLVDDNVRVSSVIVGEDTLDFCLFHEVGRTYVGFRVKVGATEPSYYQCL